MDISGVTSGYSCVTLWSHCCRSVIRWSLITLLPLLPLLPLWCGSVIPMQPLLPDWCCSVITLLRLLPCCLCGVPPFSLGCHNVV